MQAIFWPDVKKGNSQNVLSQKCFDGVNSNVCIFRKPMGCIDHTQQQRPKCFSFIGFHMHWRVAFLVRQGAGNMERCVQFNGKNNKINASVKGHLEPTHLKSSPLFTFSTKLLGQDSPSVHLFSKAIGSRFTIAKIKLGEDSPSWFIYSRSRFTFK